MDTTRRIFAAVVLGVQLIATAVIAQSPQQGIRLDPLSGTSLYLRLYAAGKPISTATGFVVKSNERFFLVTNWHVVSGRHPTNGQPLDAKGLIPDSMGIVHHAQPLGKFDERRVALISQAGNARWVEHPLGRDRDVVLVPLPAAVPPIQYFPLDLAVADVDMLPEVAMPVSIIGFPLGLTGAGMFPIWKTGHIASEPALDYDEKPVFLIDATTRGGMSGSPVVLRLTGGYRTANGGSVLASGGYQTRFLGVYSGRLPGDSNVGLVWRPRVIHELLERALK
jgi:hypothetical protein